MDGNAGKPDGAGAYIWLRYATQFKVGDRMHTIEMGVPVPIGASAEMRERLLREAEAGLEQLANRVEHRVGQVTQHAQATTRHQPGQVVAPTPKTTIPSAAASPSTSQPTPQSAQRPPTPAPIQLHEPQPTASTSSPTREAVQPPTANDKEDIAVPPTRHHIGASMPSAPGTSGDMSGSMKLPQFIQYIKESLGLSPKQAMDLLNVKTLSGLNLRDALEQLQSLVVRETAASTPTMPTPIVREQQATKTDTRTSPANTPPNAPHPLANPTPASPPTPTAIPISSVKTPGLKEITNAVVRDAPSSYPANFDEEIDLDDGEEDLDLGGDEGIEFLPELTDTERAIAGEVFDRLKEVRGTTTVGDARLRVLHNVVGDQVSDEQLLQIIDGLWGVNAFKKLKSDQVEALISWAKEDEFITEAELVIMLIQEGQYARSDR